MRAGKPPRLADRGRSGELVVRVPGDADNRRVRARARWRCPSRRSPVRTATAEAFDGERRLAADRLGLGLRRGLRGVGRRRRERRAPQPGGDAVAQALRRGFPWGKVPSYMVAQIAGGFAGRGADLPQLPRRDREPRGGAEHRRAARPTRRATVGIFVTTPAPYFETLAGPLIDQIIGTAFLVMFIFAVTDALQRARQGEPGAAGGRLHRRGDRHLVRRQRGLRDQPRARPRAAAAGVDRRAGRRWPCPATTGRSTASSGSRSSARWSAAPIGAYLYDWLIRDTLRARGADARPGDRGRGQHRRGGARDPMTSYIGAIDQGTTSSRFILFDKDGRIVAGRPARARADHAEGGLGRARRRRRSGAARGR